MSNTLKPLELSSLDLVTGGIAWKKVGFSAAVTGAQGAAYGALGGLFTSAGALSGPGAVAGGAIGAIIGGGGEIGAQLYNGSKK